MKKNKAIILYLFWVFLNVSFLIYSNEKELGYFSYFHCYFFSIIPLFLYFFMVSFNWVGKLKITYLFVLRYLIIIKVKINTLFYGIINSINDRLYMILKLVFGFIFCLGFFTFSIKLEGKWSLDARVGIMNDLIIDYGKKDKEFFDKMSNDEDIVLGRSINTLDAEANNLLSKSQEALANGDYVGYGEHVSKYVENTKNYNELKDKLTQDVKKRLEEKYKLTNKKNKEYDGVMEAYRNFLNNDADMQERLANSRHYKTHQSDMFLMNGFIVKFLEFGFCTAKTIVNLIGRQDLGVQLIDSIANISEATTGISQREMKVIDKILNGLAYILAALVFFNSLFQILNRNAIVVLKLELLLNVLFLVSLVLFFINYYHFASLLIITLLIIIFILFVYFALGLVKRIKVK